MINYICTLMPSMIEGLKMTIQVFIVTLILSVPLGIITALAKTSKFRLISEIAHTYILLMRGTPLLLQLVFVFFGLPIIGITFDRFTSVLIAFVLNYGAYFGEIFRSGIESIDKGQYEAAEVLGLNHVQTFKRIIFPQMIKRVLPPVSNEVITLIKDTALVYVVGLGELLRAGKIASNRDASLMPLIVVGLIYLLLIIILTKIFKELERKYDYYS